MVNAYLIVIFCAEDEEREEAEKKEIEWRQHRWFELLLALRMSSYHVEGIINFELSPQVCYDSPACQVSSGSLDTALRCL